MAEYIVEKKQTSGGWTWAEPKGELIRCKDCVFNHGGECWGFGDGYLVCDDDYCSYAERKEE